MADEAQGSPVFEARMQEGRDGQLETHNYTGEGGFHEPHGHIVVDEQGKVDRARDVDEKRMQKY
jgi:hypothetical protein